MGKNSDIYIYTVYGIPMLKLGIKPFKSEGGCSQLFQKNREFTIQEWETMVIFFWKQIVEKCTGKIRGILTYFCHELKLGNRTIQNWGCHFSKIVTNSPKPNMEMNKWCNSSKTGGFFFRSKNGEDFTLQNWGIFHVNFSTGFTRGWCWWFWPTWRLHH